MRYLAALIPETPLLTRGARPRPRMNTDRLRALGSNLDRAVGRRDALVARQGRLRAEISALENDEVARDLVIQFFRTLIDQEITEAVTVVESLLTEGLQAVFTDQNLSVKAEIEIQRGKVAVNLQTVQSEGGRVVSGAVLDSFGGSVQTVQSVLMRVISIYLRGLRPFLILDESLPAFDQEYVVNMGKFLAVLSKRLGMDILLVTHNQALVEAADKAYLIEKRAGEAHFTPIGTKR